MNPARLSADRLSDAAARYERLRSSGERPDLAFRLALSALGYEVGAVAPDRIPPELPAVIRGYVQWVACDRWRPVLAEVTQGTSRVPYYCHLRDEIAWALRQMSYHERQIGAAMGRDRTSILCGFRRMELRLREDDVLRARVARFVSAAAEKAAA